MMSSLNSLIEMLQRGEDSIRRYREVKDNVALQGFNFEGHIVTEEHAEVVQRCLIDDLLRHEYLNDRTADQRHVGQFIDDETSLGDPPQISHHEDCRVLPERLEFMRGCSRRQMEYMLFFLDPTRSEWRLTDQIYRLARCPLGFPPTVGPHHRHR